MKNNISPCPVCGYNGSGSCQSWACPRRKELAMKNPVSKYVWWCPYQGMEHLNLIINGWHEHECVYVEDEVWIKVSKWM